MTAQVWTMGETMVSLRAQTPVTTSPVWTTHVAGAESNAAIGLARLGHRVRWWSRLGDDDFGRLVARELRAEGVDVAAVIDTTRPTGHLLLAPTSFAAAVSYHRAGSAASALTADEALADLCGHQPQVVLLSGITPALGDQPRRASLAVAERARALGARVVIDVNYRTKLWSPHTAAPVLSCLVGHADVVVGSPHEIDLVGGVDELLDRGIDAVVIKLGADGCRWVSATETVTGETDAVAELDPVGAGDGFTAGLTSGLLDELPIDRVLRRANLVGAAAVRHRGDWEGLPTRAEVASRVGSPDIVR